MNPMLKTLLVSLLLMGLFAAPSLRAAPRDAGKPDNGAVQKLQAMVKSLTSERDAAKAETAKLTAELDQLKKDNSKAVAAADSARQQVDSELAAQKSSNAEVRDRLEKTNARLLEVIEKYKELTQNKNELSSELTALKSKQQSTEQQLNICGEHNVKLLESGKELLDRYQNKGSIGALLQDEPALQFNSVEMENIIQDYDDKLRSGIYKSNAVTPAVH